MADTIQTRSQLQTAYANNLTGNISAQQGRNLIVTSFGALQTRDPSINDDSANTLGTGYFDTGSRWLNTTTSVNWVCLNGAVSAAVWVRVAQLLAMLNSAGPTYGPEPIFNFVAGSGISIAIGDFPGAGYVRITISATGTGTVSGSGTVGTLPIWTASTAIGDSALTQTGSGAGSTLTSAGAFDVGGTLGVTGNTTLSGTLSAQGTTVTSLAASGNATVGGTLGVTGNTTLSGTLSAQGTTVTSLAASGNATVGGTLGITGNTTLSGTLSAQGTTVTSLTNSGNETIAGTLGVTGAITGGGYSGGAISGTTGHFSSTIYANGGATTGDVGTGLVAIGLFSGTPTFSAANLTGSLPTSVLPATNAQTLGATLASIPAVPTWYRVTATHTNLGAAAMSNTITGLVVPADTVVHGAKAVVTTLFSGGGIVAYSLSAGKTGNNTAYLSTVSGTALVNTVYVGPNPYTLDGLSHTATNNLTISANCTGANLNAATAGVVEVWYLLSGAT